MCMTDNKCVVYMTNDVFFFDMKFQMRLCINIIIVDIVIQKSYEVS